MGRFGYLRAESRSGLGFHAGPGPELRTGPSNSAQKYPDRPRPTLYDPEFCVDSDFEVRFGVAHRNLELQTQFGQTVPIRLKNRIHHQCLTLSTRSWAQTTTVGRERSSMVSFSFSCRFSIGGFLESIRVMNPRITPPVVRSCVPHGILKHMYGS